MNGPTVLFGRPRNVIKGLTLSADFYHIDLRNVISGRDANIILANNFDQ